jgi:hypothetical protein
MAKLKVKGTPLLVQIVGADGEPVARASLSVIQSSAPFPEIALLANARGIISLRLPAGRFTLRATAADGRSGEVTLASLPPEHTVVEIVVR